MSESPYRLPAIPYLRLRVTLRAEERALLPGYKGSMLRGAFGHALRRAVCAMGPKQACASCALRRECVYPRLFETLIEGEAPPFLKGLSTAPRPYVFEPAQEEMGRREYAAGETLSFDLLLFGRAVELQAYALLAIERMAEAGLGRRRQRFVLERVEHPAPPGDGGGWRAGFVRGERTWQEPVPAAVPDPGALAPVLAGGAVELRLLTPLRIKSDGRVDAPFNFRKLVFLAVRRALEVTHFHGVDGQAAELDWEFRPLLEAASRVRIAERDLEWYDWERWSNRQGTSMRFGGHVGRLRLEGELEPFAELLATAEVLHVGKGATFGLGRVEVG